jgi:hypothetical protein
MKNEVLETKLLGNHVFADLVKETLSDGSHAFNVEIREDNATGFDLCSPANAKIELPCFNSKAAKALMNALVKNVV